MNLRSSLLLSLSLFFHLLSYIQFLPAVSIVTSTTTTYNTSTPTDNDVANWSTGWGATNINALSYIGRSNVNGGTSNGNPIVYLGNGWAMTADHVYTNNSTWVGFNSVTFNQVSYSKSGLHYQIANSDIHLFQILPTRGSLPDLPWLTIRHDPLVVENATTGTEGTRVFMTGAYSTAGVISWGYNRVTSTATHVATVSNGAYNYSDTFDANAGPGSGTNSQAHIINGDSGGGDFSFNSFTNTWELIGINNSAGGTYNNYVNRMVNLSHYYSDIEAIRLIPEPEMWTLFSIGLAALLFLKNRKHSPLKNV